ncbi:MAG: hypothetical protein ACXWRU_19570 [Pseudobdellovibrionaceae bacterium]
MTTCLAADPCADSIVTSCDFFNNLNPNDSIEFSDGFRSPACALESSPLYLRMNEGERKLAARVAILLQKFPLKKRESAPLKNWSHLIFQPISQLSMEDKKILGKDGLRELSSIMEEESGYFNQLISQKKSHIKFNMSGQSDRRRRLFQKAKQAVQNQFLQGRNQNELNGVEASIFNRLSAIQLDEKEAIPAELDCNSPTSASFKYDEDKIVVPPELMFFPDQSILRSLIHEFAHSFDLCSLSGERDNDRKWFKKKRTASQLAETPFYDAIQCLQSEDGGGFGNSKKLTALSRGSMCSVEYQKSHEAFADWVSAETLQANPDLLESKQSLGPVPPKAFDGKIVKAPVNSQTLFYAFDHRCGEDEIHNLDHPLWGQRINGIWLHYSRLRPKVCKPVVPPICYWPNRKINGSSVKFHQFETAQ